MYDTVVYQLRSTGDTRRWQDIPQGEAHTTAPVADRAHTH